MAKWLPIEKCDVREGYVLMDDPSVWAHPKYFQCGPEQSDNLRAMRFHGATVWQTPPMRGKTPKSGQKATGYTEEFETKVWAPYPRKLNSSKLEGFKSWSRLMRAEQESVIAVMPSFVLMCRGKDEGYIPHLATWINQKRFETITVSTMTPPSAPSAGLSESQWRSAMSIFVKTSNWNPALGDAPGSSNCRVPPAVLKDFGMANA